MAGQRGLFSVSAAVFEKAASFPQGVVAKRNGGALAESTGLPGEPPPLAVRGEAAAVRVEGFLVGKFDPLAVELREGERGAGVLGEVGAEEDEAPIQSFFLTVL